MVALQPSYNSLMSQEPPDVVAEESSRSNESTPIAPLFRANMADYMPNEEQAEELYREALEQIGQIGTCITEIAQGASEQSYDPEVIYRIRNEVNQLSTIVANEATRAEQLLKKNFKKRILTSSPTGEKDNGKRKHRSSQASPNLYCKSCGTTQTPEWRRGPDGLKSLCNACGLHYAKIIKREVLVPSRKAEAPQELMSVRTLLN